MDAKPNLLDRLDQGMRALADDGLILSAIKLTADDMGEAMALFACPKTGRLRVWPRYRGLPIRRTMKGPSVVIGLAPCARRERQAI